MKTKQAIKAAFKSLNEFSQADIEVALEAALERIEELEDALTHIKKTARGHADGSVTIDPLAFECQKTLEKFINWALKEF